MEHTPRYGTAAVSTPKPSNNVNSVFTPCTPGYVVSPTQLCGGTASDYHRRSFVESDALTPEETERRCEPDSRNFRFNADTLRSTPSTGTIPTPNNQAKTGVHKLRSPDSSSGDTFRWSGTKKQKLSTTRKNEGLRSAFSWPRHTFKGINNDFTTPKMPLLHQQVGSGGQVFKTSSWSSERHYNKGSTSTGSSSSDEESSTLQLNKAFRLSSNESCPLSESKQGNQTTLRNSSNSTTQKETTPSSDISQSMQFKATRAPFTQTSSSTRKNEDSMTAKDVTHTRAKSGNRHVLSDDEQPNQVQKRKLVTIPQK